MSLGGFNDEIEIQRLSILSATKISNKDASNQLSKDELAPPDKYHITHIIFFVLAIGQMIPYTFFTVSQDVTLLIVLKISVCKRMFWTLQFGVISAVLVTEYWMYKFRDTSSEEVNLNNKTMLQKNFLAVNGLGHTIPSILTTIISSYYGHKINLHTRLIGCYTGLTAVFIVYTAFVKINTDTWQLTFFVMTVIISSFITVASNLLAITTYPMISRFPLIYTKSHMYGTSASGLISVLLQILCLKLGGSSTSVALIYFLCGTGILTLALICAITCKNLPRFAYYLGDTVADTSRPTLKFGELKTLIKGLWPYLVLTLTGFLTSGMAATSMTTLIVSEYYGTGEWGNKYFEPVVIFLLPDIFGLIGKYFAAPILNHKNAVWYVLVDGLRILIIEPLYMFCNAQPRKHFPVLFPHDWEYMIITSVGGFARMFFAMSTFMSMSNLVPDQIEQGYIFMGVMFSLTAAFSSTLGTIWVNMI